MKTAIMTFEQYQGKINIGSSRIRGHWIVDQWQKAGKDIGECEEFKIGGKYDAIVFQKVYFPEYAKLYKGIKILDICDPDFLNWVYPIKEMIDAVDAVTTSSKELALYITQLTDKPVHWIDDRVNFDQIPPPKKHYGDAKIAVYFGYSHNYEVLEQCLPALAQRNMELIVVSDHAFYSPMFAEKVPTTNYPFSEANWIADIQKGDFVLNPKSKKGRFKFKSDNKTVTAWALGMPTVMVDKDIDRIIDGEVRQKLADALYAEAKEKYNTKTSVEQLKDLIVELNGNRT